MKLKTKPNSGIITVEINTAQGVRTVSTGTKDPQVAKAVIEAARLKEIEVLAKAGALTQALVQKLVIGGNMTVSQAVSEWEQWLRDTSGSDRTAETHVIFV